MIGYIAHRRLNYERQKSAGPGDNPYLGESKRKLGNKHRKKRIDKRKIKITYKMDRNKGKDNLRIFGNNDFAHMTIIGSSKDESPASIGKSTDIWIY